jgi:hypothetical protein
MRVASRTRARFAKIIQTAMAIAGAMATCLKSVAIANATPATTTRRRTAAAIALARKALMNASVLGRYPPSAGSSETNVHNVRRPQSRRATNRASGYVDSQRRRTCRDHRQPVRRPFVRPARHPFRHGEAGEDRGRLHVPRVGVELLAVRDLVTDQRVGSDVPIRQIPNKPQPPHRDRKAQ